MTILSETLAGIIAHEWEIHHGQPESSPRQHRQFHHQCETIAQHIREGWDELDTVLITGCSRRLYRRFAAAFAVAQIAAEWTPPTPQEEQRYD